MIIGPYYRIWKISCKSSKLIRDNGIKYRKKQKITSKIMKLQKKENKSTRK